MAAQLNIPPGGRRSRNWNLGEEIRSRLQPMHYSAPFGIIGARETGRKSLALRFADMEAEVLPQEDEQLFFNSFHRITFDHDFQRPITLHLMAVICPPPTIAGRRMSTNDLQNQDKFCCLVFLFDVARRETFEAAKIFMRRHADLTTNFLVGNKCDLRQSVAEDLTVSRDEIDEEISRCRMAYHEISARTRQDVQKLLDAIQRCALHPKYSMQVNQDGT